jgi:hypothetical protein
MFSKEPPLPSATFYCLCSAMSYEEMLKKQKDIPLKFAKFIDQYTDCNRGCGSCIDSLHKYLLENCLLIE